MNATTTRQRIDRQYVVADFFRDFTEREAPLYSASTSQLAVLIADKGFLPQIDAIESNRDLTLEAKERKKSALAFNSIDEFEAATGKVRKEINAANEYIATVRGGSIKLDDPAGAIRAWEIRQRLQAMSAGEVAQQLNIATVANDIDVMLAIATAPSVYDWQMGPEAATTFKRKAREMIWAINDPKSAAEIRRLAGLVELVEANTQMLLDAAVEVFGPYVDQRQQFALREMAGRVVARSVA